jgi:hypothetical protein
MSVLSACAFSVRREYLDNTIPNFVSECVNNCKSSISKSDPSDVNLGLSWILGSAVFVPVFRNEM